MKKLLILVLWLLGLAAIAWWCLREAAPTSTTVPAVPAAPPLATTSPPGPAAVPAPAPMPAAAPASAPPEPPAAAAPPASPVPSPAASAASARIDSVLEGRVIEFATGRAELTPAGRAIVAQIAAILRESERLKVEVRGHTDATGVTEANDALSLARAQAVGEALSAQGVDRSRLAARGFGASRPVADNATAEGRARNRRIEFHVEETQ